MVLEGYRGASLKKLKSFDVAVGDEVRLHTEDSVIEGILMPRYELADDEHIVVKLKTGYNTGILASRVSDIEVLARGTEPTFRTPPRPKLVEGLPRVLVIGTGGTIASRIDYRTGGVKPALSSEELYHLVPELASVAEVETHALFNIYSENMTPRHWSLLAKRVGEAVTEGYDGIVITHGTDTLHYTAAALTFALEGLPLPVVVVGSQRSSDRPSSDAATNLVGAVRVASKSPIAGVFVVMHAGMDDDRLAVHLGVRVRKNHSSRRDAFQSVNVDPVGYVINDEVQIYVGPHPLRSSDSSKFRCRPEFSDKVALFKVHPGFEPGLIELAARSGCKAIVLEGTGLGHVPSSLYPAIRGAIEEGAFVGMATQTIWGSVRMTVYNTGRDLLSMGVVPLRDMLSEVALAKASWLAGQGVTAQEFKSAMAANLRGEISDRRPIR